MPIIPDLLQRVTTLEERLNSLEESLGLTTADGGTEKGGWLSGAGTVVLLALLVVLFVALAG